MYDIAIIGSGPAGGSAAIFTAKAGKSTLLLDSDQSITKKAWIENHYGAPDITGPDLIETGIRQAEKHGADYKKEKVSDIETKDGSFLIQTEGASHEAKHIILATGVSADLAQKIGLTLKEGSEPKIKNVIDVDREGKTGIKGIWAAGTVAGVSVHTIVTAGDGAKVAINLLSEINGERYVDHDILRT